uniref:Alpha-galactosidase n=1 Tax=Schistosoma haematobium TaxID=6185 RepID=A0A095A3Q8_SCHHA
MCLDNGLARTPPMGWSTVYALGCRVDCQRYPNNCLNEDAIKRTADKLVSDGWRELGYKYVILDDCWLATQRDPITNRIMADPSRFPNRSTFIVRIYLNSEKIFRFQGMEYIAKYLHSKNLLLGVTLSNGAMTCARYPGSMNHLELDAKTVADWGVDYVKMLACHYAENTAPDGFEKFHRLLNATGRPVMFLCTYPAYSYWLSNSNLIDWERLQNNCNLWRVWSNVQSTWGSIIGIINRYKLFNDVFPKVAGPGHYNDPDVLVLGLWIRKLDNCPIGWAIACINTKVDGGPIDFSTNLDEFKSQMYTISGDKFELLDVFTGDRFKDVRLTENFTISINPSGIMMFRVNPYKLVYSYQ